jgi:ribosomal-protein-alanine N-acetyltransferase
MSAVVRPRQGLRPMTDEDLQEVFAIERATYHFPWTLGIFRDCLHVGYSCWVCEREGTIDAYGVMSMGAGEAHILTIVVRESARDQGLGAQMLNHMINTAKRHKADNVVLEVRPSNKIAIHLYHKHGFKDVGSRRGYYPGVDHREDAIVMSLDLRKPAEIRSFKPRQ